MSQCLYHKSRNLNYRKTDIQVTGKKKNREEEKNTEIKIYKLQENSNTNHRYIDIQITEIQKFKLQITKYKNTSENF